MDARLIDRFPSGIVRPPSSKSLGHRAVVCAALANSESVIRRVNLSEDIQATLDGVTVLGARWHLDGGTLFVSGGQNLCGHQIDCGESGSTLRFLIPVAALSAQETVFTGRGRLLERPMETYARVLPSAGATFFQEDGCIRTSGPLRGGVYTLPGDVSSQFFSGLLFALPLAHPDSELHLTTALESAPYVTLTLDVMRRFGVKVTQKDGIFSIPGGQRYHSCDITLEADYSQAAFFLASAALGRPVRCAGLDPNSRQGDRAILRVLRDMGVSVDWNDGLVSAKAERLNAVTVDLREIPDLAPPIAALCCFAEGTSRIINAGRLRLKESDRLSALAGELGRLGADIEEGPDSLTIRGKPSLPGGQADAQGDHRIAMATAVAAIRCTGPVTLTGYQSVNKSYPQFWKDFEVER